MGTVYRAVDEVLGRDVAVKVLNSKLADSGMMERFRREAILLARLSHPRIATIFELFRSEGDLLMVLELVRGETLEKISDRMGVLPPGGAADLVEQILSALEHAHRAGVVHRDLKPANVMVTEHGDIKVMDFGVARVRVAEHVDSYMVGTPAYISPEQILGKHVDARSDLYSAGVVFYRLLTGTLPFKADTALAMLQNHLSELPTPLHVHRGDLPDWCEAIVQRALAKAPRDRFQTAQEFRKELGGATGIVTTNLRNTLSVRVAEDHATTSPEPSVLERFGVTLLPSASTAAPNHLSSGIDGALESGGIPAGNRHGDAPTEVAKDTTIVLRSGHPDLRRWSVPVLAGILVALTIAGFWRPRPEPRVGTGDVPLPANESTSQPSGPGSGNSPNRTVRPPVASARPSASGSSASATVPAPAAERSARRPSTPPPDGRGLSVSPPATSAPRTAAPDPVTASLAEPVAFRARTLVGDGDGWRERECQVIIVDGQIIVQRNDDHALLYSVPYRSVLTISYSRGRDPLWNGPDGPTRIVRTGGGPLGIFRGARHWVSLRTKNPNAGVVVLRLGNEAQARSAIAVIEERTGRTAEIVERDE
jgi:serine/threonine protein kinase